MTDIIRPLVLYYLAHPASERAHFYSASYQNSPVLASLVSLFPSSLRDQLYIAGTDTTRAPRPGETHRKQYFFISHGAFKQLIHDVAFIEHAEFSGNLYGTSFQTVHSFLHCCFSFSFLVLRLLFFRFFLFLQLFLEYLGVPLSHS